MVYFVFEEVTDIKGFFFHFWKFAIDFDLIEDLL